MTSYVDIAIDPVKNDIAFSGGKIKYVKSADEIIQRVRTCLRRIKGEWFLDETAGLPYFDGDMLGGKDTEYVKLIIIQELNKIIGVNTIKEINVLLNGYEKKASVYVSIVIDEKVYEILEEI